MPTTADLGSSQVLSYLRDLCAKMVVYSDIINRYQKELKIRKILLYSQCAEVKREAAKFNWEAQKNPVLWETDYSSIFSGKNRNYRKIEKIEKTPGIKEIWLSGYSCLPTCRVKNAFFGNKPFLKKAGHTSAPCGHSQKCLWQ